MKFTLVVICIFAIAATVKALNVKLSGLNYNSRKGADWVPLAKKCKSQLEINSDIATLSDVTNNVRIYSLVDCDQARMVIKAIKKVNKEKNLKMKVWLGIWVAGKVDPKHFKKEKNALAAMIKEGLVSSDVVKGIHVGSETIYRKDISADNAIKHMKDIKSFLAAKKIAIPVSIADIVDTFINYPKLVEAVDVVSVNQFPFWEKTDIKKSGARFYSRLQPLLKLAGKKKVIISETGWSSDGFNKNASTTSPESQVEYFKQFYILASKYNWEYFYFSSFDAAWKQDQEKGDEKTVEAHFGIFSAAGTMKKGFKDLKINLDQISRNGSSSDREDSKDDSVKDGGDSSSGSPVINTPSSINLCLCFLLSYVLVNL